MAKYVDSETVRLRMMLYGFRAPDMTVTEFVDDLPTEDVTPVTSESGKIMTHYAKLKVGKTNGEYIFYIKYVDRADHMFHNGFPSFDIRDVQKKLREDFEIIKGHGRWVQPHWRNSNYACNCSACSEEAIHSEYEWHKKGIYPVCPNCGATMLGD